MRGTVEVPSDAILCQLQLWPRRLPPEVLELIALPFLGGEDMEDGVEVVEDDPTRRPLALDPAGQQAVLLLEMQLHLLDDRPCLALVARRADRQEVGVGGEAAHV